MTTSIVVGEPPHPSAGEAATDALAEVYPLTVPVTTGPGSRQLEQGPGRLCGWSLLETSGAAAVIAELYDGMDVSAQLLAVIAVPAGSSTPFSMDGVGVEFRSGLFLNVISGSVRGAVWARVRDAT